MSRSYLAIALCKSAGDATAGRWYHTLPPIGEYPMPIHLKTGTIPGILVIDATANASILTAFAQASSNPAFPGILVDREHASEQPEGDSGAAAWAKELEQRDDGLWTRWDLTAAGEPLIVGRVYAYRSPAMDLEPVDDVAKSQFAASREGRKPRASSSPGRWRPTCIASIALTNKPHFKDLSPALGRAENTESQNMDKTALCQKLGLDPEKATEADILAAIDALLASKADAATAKAAATAAQGELAQVRARQLDADCDAFVLAHKSRIKDEPAVRAQFKANPDATRALFGALAPERPETPARVLARSSATNPGERDAAAAANAKRGADRNASIARVAAREGIGRREAVAIARRENPELWEE